MGVTGDFGGLDDLRRALQEAGSRETRISLAKNLGEEARTQAVIGFQRSVDPYDKQWKPLRSREGQPLRDSGRLQNSIHWALTPSGFVVTTDAKYAAVHQYGATIRAKTPKGLRFRVGGARPRTSGKWVNKREVEIPRRQFMPEGNIGARWAKALEAVADAVVRRMAGGR